MKGNVAGERKEKGGRKMEKEMEKREKKRRKMRMNKIERARKV